jgi:DNA modification methylase
MGAPYYQDDTVRLFHGDCLDVLTELPDASVDAVVTDPPYGLANTDPAHVVDTIHRWTSGERDYIPTGAGFMGKAWDAFVPPVAVWDDCLRILKPGGHLLAFAGSRTFDLMTLAIRMAGFEVRDSIAYLYGAGFPKSLNPYRSIMGACQNSANAPHAVRISKFIPVLSSAGRGPIALALARIQPGDAPVLLTETGGAANSSARTATLLSALAERMNLSTDLLWNILWDANSGRASMSTTSTTSRTTTVSAILSSLPSKTTPANTTTDPNLPRGCSCAAFTAGLGLSGISTGSNVIPVLTAPESATGGPLEPLKGFGTSAKPAFEPIVVARKPLQGTVAANVLEHGTGGLNIDGCRIGTGSTRRPLGKPLNGGAYGSDRDARESLATVGGSDSGRWPANVILDEDQAAALDEQSGMLTSGANPTRRGSDKSRNAYGEFTGQEECTPVRGIDTGGASRFFYTSKADQAERISYYRPSCNCEEPWPTTNSPARATDGTPPRAPLSTSKSGNSPTENQFPPDTRSTTSTETRPTTIPTTLSRSLQPITSESTRDANSGMANGGNPAESATSSNGSAQTTGTSARKVGHSMVGVGRATSPGWSSTSVCGECGVPPRRESHATVKPLDLMRWLVRLVTPPQGGLVVDPFAGSGTTVEAAILEGFRCVAIEREADYLPLITQRIHRRRDPVKYLTAAGDDLGLFADEDVS